MSENPVIQFGNKYWYQNGKLHRDDGPALEYADGEKRWYQNGNLHRLDKPAIEWADGYKAWYINGKRHRIDGPAQEWSNGEKEWWIEDENYTEEEFNNKIAEMNNKNPEIDENGTKRWFNEKRQYHRDDGPAIEYSNGDKLWFQNDKLHRLDGPAVEWSDKEPEWYIEGVKYTEEEFNKKLAEMKLPQIDNKGNKFWYNEKGESHRDDGPACEYKNGTKAWYVDNKYHRDDGPAFEGANGEKEWFVNGERHRLDGPAVERDRRIEWWIEGVKYTEEEFNKKIVEMNNKNPVIDKNGTKIWKNEKGEYHRDDGPAIEYANGSKAWYQYNKLHRLDGPAQEWSSGNKQWWIEDKNYTEEEYNKKIAEMNNNNPKINNGVKFWYNEKGQLHRTDGPAKEYPNGNKLWFQNDKLLYRLDGPAVEWSNREQEWYIEGKEYTEKEYHEKIAEMQNINPKINSNGSKFWYNEKGEYHRLDGPAVEWGNGNKEWWIEDEEYTEEEYNKKILEIMWKTTKDHISFSDVPPINFNLSKEPFNITYKEFKNTNIKIPKISEISFAKQEDSSSINPINVSEKSPEKYKEDSEVKPNTKDVIKDRLEKAAYRSASRQIVKGISNVIVKIAEQKGMDSFTAQAIGKFFETELGASLIGAIIGVGIPYIPKINQDKRALKIAEEFQVESIATVTDTVLNEVLTYVLPVVSEALNTLPTRIEEQQEDIEESVNVSNTLTK